MKTTFIVPTLRVGTRFPTLRVVDSCVRQGASGCLGHLNMTQSVGTRVPTQSVGTSFNSRAALVSFVRDASL